MLNLQRHTVECIVGVSEWARRTREKILQIADHSSNVLICGPSGTGKELIARALHTHSSRASQPFIPADCASLPGTLFASQMFGHTKGAFTGAHSAALGCFRAAHGGTIFLDEIGELDQPLQAKLLRVIQEKMVIPLGSHKEIPVDIRIIAATNRNPEKEVLAGRFREDLFYRLNVLRMEASSLKQRSEDIEVLVNHFMTKMSIDNGLPFKKLSKGAMNLLSSYHWPGNIRELANVLERAVVLSKGDVIDAGDLPQLAEAVLSEITAALEPAARNEQATAKSVTRSDGQFHEETADELMRKARHLHAIEDRPLTLAELEHTHIQFILDRTSNNISAAARFLKIDRRLLLRKMKKYGLSVPTRRGRPSQDRSSDIR